MLLLFVFVVVVVVVLFVLFLFVRGCFVFVTERRLKTTNNVYRFCPCTMFPQGLPRIVYSLTCNDDDYDDDDDKNHNVKNDDTRFDLLTRSLMLVIQVQGNKRIVHISSFGHLASKNDLLLPPVGYFHCLHIFNIINNKTTNVLPISY